MKKNLLKNWNPTETRLKNIERKVRILDRDVQFHDGIPIPSWIELNVIDACNRSCSFCPKADPKIAPNTYQKMPIQLIDKLFEDLKKINFEGTVNLFEKIKNKTNPEKDSYIFHLDLHITFFSILIFNINNYHF